MSFSLNCLVLGQSSTKIFRMRFGDLVPVGGFDVDFDKLTVADFKEALSEKSGITSMNVWKVELGFYEINNIFTEGDIRNHNKSEKMDDNPMLNFNKYYN